MLPILFVNMFAIFFVSVRRMDNMAVNVYIYVHSTFYKLNMMSRLSQLENFSKNIISKNRSFIRSCIQLYSIFTVKYVFKAVESDNLFVLH